MCILNGTKHGIRVVVYRTIANGRSLSSALVRPISIVPAGLQSNFNRHMFILLESQGLHRDVIFCVSNPRFYSGCRHVYVPFSHGSSLQSLVSITKDVAFATKSVTKQFICQRFAFRL